MPASRAACVPRLHRHADIGLRQRRRVVGAVAAHGDQPPARLFAADIGELVLGRRLGEEIIHPGLGGDGGSGHRVVAGDHHRADAHGAQCGEAFADAGLDHVLQVDHAEQLGLPPPASGVPPDRAIGPPPGGTRQARGRVAARVSAGRHRPRPCGCGRPAGPARNAGSAR